MKKIITGLLLLMSFNLYAQKNSQLPLATGTGKGGYMTIVQNGVTKRIPKDSVIADAIKRADSTAAVLQAAINQNTTVLSTKQTNLQTGINFPSINGIPLANNPNNIVIAGASQKPLYKSITSSGGIATWNYDSSSTVNLINEGTANLTITGSVPTGATGILVFTQGSVNTDLLKYNGTFLNIGKAPGKISLVGFYKTESGYIFSIDTATNIIAAAGSYDTDAQALFTAAGTNFTYKNAVNNAIVALKGITLAAGGTAWSKSVLINGRAGTSLDQQAFNWRNPAQYKYLYNGTFNYNPNGTQFDGVPNYINTQISPASAFTGTTSDFAVVNVVGSYPATPGGIIFGSVNTTNNQNLYVAPRATQLIYQMPGMGAVDIIVSSPAATGRFVVFYSAATTINSIRNGTLLDSQVTTVNQTLGTPLLYEGAVSYDNTTSPGLFATCRIDVTHIINSKLTLAEAQAIDAVWAAYETALSR